MNQSTDTANFALLAGEAQIDPIEERFRTTVSANIEAVVEEKLASFLGRLLYDRGDGSAKGYRQVHRRSHRPAPARPIHAEPPRSREPVRF